MSNSRGNILWVDDEIEHLKSLLFKGLGDDKDFEVKVKKGDLLSVAEARRQAETKRLRKIVRSGSVDKRIASVKVLAKRKPDDSTISLLIYAMTDPDYRVVNAAHQSLCFFSRKLDGFGLKRLKNNVELKKRKANVNATVFRWKRWYRKLRPNVQFTVFGK